MTPSRTWWATNGSIIPCSRAIFLIQWSGLMDIGACRGLRFYPTMRRKTSGISQGRSQLLLSRGLGRVLGPERPQRARREPDVEMNPPNFTMRLSLEATAYRQGPGSLGTKRTFQIPGRP